jgi:hypothetical protein
MKPIAEPASAIEQTQRQLLIHRHYAYCLWRLTE